MSGKRLETEIQELVERCRSSTK